MRREPNVSVPIQRPSWLPKYLPELDGLRGAAILAVVLYHCKPRLVGTWLYGPSLWGWAGVTLFFFLSGFLITANLLTTRDDPRYFHNFHARRALRIWPLYLLLLAVCYLNSEWFVGLPVFEAFRTAPWWAYLLCIQNLFTLALPPAVGPTWALAIEEQYYFLWAPAVRWLRRPWMLFLLLIAALVAPPIIRSHHHAWITPTHTLIHLDGIALGSLLALGLYTLGGSQKRWRALGALSFAGGIAAAATIAGGTAYLDSALAFGLGGLAILLITSTGSPWLAVFRRGPLRYYGKVSYGLYLCHISVFIYFGWFDRQMDAYGTVGNLAVVAFRIAASTAVATLLWYGLESRILKLKNRF